MKHSFCCCRMFQRCSHICPGYCHPSANVQMYDKYRAQLLHFSPQQTLDYSCLATNPHDNESSSGKRSITYHTICHHRYVFNIERIRLIVLFEMIQVVLGKECFEIIYVTRNLHFFPLLMKIVMTTGKICQLLLIIPDTGI